MTGPFCLILGAKNTCGGYFLRHHSLSHVPEMCLKSISDAVTLSRVVAVLPLLRPEEYLRTSTSHTVWAVFRTVEGEDVEAPGGWITTSVVRWRSVDGTDMLT